MDETVFIDDIISDYYSEIGKSYKSSLKPGQIIWSYFLYGYNDLDVWRPAVLDSSNTIATKFEINSSPSNKFKKSIPLSSPPLAVNEEFVVVKAKPRPAILITLPAPSIHIQHFRKGGKINIDSCLMAPLFSLEDDYGRTKYPEEFINRVRKLIYPHLFFLPKDERINLKNSLCRFDRISPVYTTHIEKEKICLHKEIADIYFSQLQCYLMNIFNGDYKVARELINEK
jgi:hypothetical protein